MPRVNMIPVSRSCAGSYLLIAAHAAFLAELQIKNAWIEATDLYTVSCLNFTGLQSGLALCQYNSEIFSCSSAEAPLDPDFNVLEILSGEQF